MAFKNKAAHTAMMKGRLDLLVKQAFFGTLAMQLELVEVTNPAFCDTMAVDGVNLFYWPPFVLSLTTDELTGVEAHEVHHCCYKHMTRRGHRNPLRWNWAGDYVINDDLLKAGFTLPKQRLHDPKYANMSTEEVYERLPDPPQIYVLGSGKGGSGGSKSKDSQSDQDGLPDGADKGRCGGVLDAAPASNKVEAQRIEQEWEGNVRMAAAIARRQNAGTLPGFLERLVGTLAKPKINWRDVLRQFVDGNMSVDYTWQRPNRRFVHTGLTLPGTRADALHHLLFFNDVSGSITTEIIEAYGGEVQSTLDDGVADKVTALFFDTEIKKIDEYNQGDLIDLNTRGGGGTDFRPMMEWASKEAQDASCIVVLTDMLPCSWDLPDPGVPVLWGAYLPEEHLKTIKPPFGEVLHIDSANW
jgi:predicted metal-dependent peptidase